MRSLRTLLLVGLMLGAGEVSLAQAQALTPGQLLFGRSSWENGDLSLFRMNRMPVGARFIGMGYTGLALEGGPSSQGLNAASVLGVLRPTMVAESKLITGSATPQNAPQFIDLGPVAGILQTSDYRVSVNLDFDYDFLSAVVPIRLFGKRGALSASYSRSARTGRETETRVELRGAITQQSDATFGLGDVPDQGMDVLTAGVAREITSYWNLGVNLNWYSGQLIRDINQGISIFGTQLGGGGSAYQQDVSGFNVDIGTQLEFGNLDLGGSIFLGHDLEFTGGKGRYQAIPTPGQTTPVFEYGAPDMTMNVPTMIGGGLAYHVGERLVVSADYWYRPWSDTEVTRGSLDPVIGFADTSVVGSYFYALVPVENETETFSANLENTNSFGFGIEYKVVDKPGFEVPVRLGYNRGKTTQSNLAVPSYLWDQFDSPDSAGLHLDSYNDLIGAYFVASKVAPNDSLTLALGNALKQIDEYDLALFRNGSPTLSTITMGAGVRIDNVTADLALSFQGYTWTQFYLQPFDPTLNPIPTLVTQNRGLTNIVLSIGMSF